MLPSLSGGSGNLLKFVVVGLVVVTFGSVLLSFLMKLAVLALIGYVALRILKSYLKTEKPAETEPISSPVPEPEPTPSEAPTQEINVSGWLSDRARAVGRFVVEVLAGTLAGALLGLIAGWESPDRTSSIALGALIGAALGIFAGLRSMVSVPEEEEPAPQPDGTS